MIFPAPPLQGILVKRYKRFLADVQLPDGQIVVAHCPNSGSMKTCSEPGREVLLTDHGLTTHRKLRYTLEAIHMGDCWVGINTFTPNHVVAEAVRQREIPELAGYPTVTREVTYGPARRSRIDLLLTGHATQPDCYVEIKNTTMLDAGGVRFPDAVSQRGKKHLDDLAWAVQQGFRSVIFFFVGRQDAAWFGPADAIDPAYGETLRQAVGSAGVELLAYRASISPRGVALEKRLHDVRFER